MLVHRCDFCKEVIEDPTETLYHVQVTRVEDFDMVEYPKLDAHRKCMPTEFLAVLNDVSGRHTTKDELQETPATAPPSEMRRFRR